jgi:sigma-E factor negative regulatory protein RseB
MKRWLIRGVCCLSLVLSWPALAQQQPDGMTWLARVVAAAHTLNYSGTFVYQNGAQTETSRITHMVDGGKEFERLEVLDGSPREVIRNNEEVKCYLPESRTLIIEKRGQRSSFPVLLPTSLAGITESYAISKGPAGRVAEHDSQSILLESKDDLRYGHQFWIDMNSGLLLKASMLNERGQSIETFAFTQLQIGGNIDREALKSKFGAQSAQWQVHNVLATEARGENEIWQFKAQLPGFRKLAGMNRLSRSDRPESVHQVFSDGLVAISVFIEALPEKPELGMATLGAINVYQRSLGDRLIIVMGEVPQATLKKLGDGIEARKK